MLSTLKNHADFDSFVGGDDPAVLAEIYQASTNLCVWQRRLDTTITQYVDVVLKQITSREIRIVVNSDDVAASILKKFPQHSGSIAFAEDVTSLVTMYSDLFGLVEVGLRLSVLDKTMCPRFHTDNLPCRLVTTYAGSGTEWLPEYEVDRSKLGSGSNGLPDAMSGVYVNQQNIQQLTTGDVALLKGSGWQGNEDSAIVHRSPVLALHEKRLLLTLDFGN